MFHTWLLKIGVYLFRRPRFRKWAVLEDKRYNVIKAVEETNGGFPNLVHDYASTALYLPFNYEKVFWKDMLLSFIKIHSVTSPKTSIPIVSRSSNTKQEKNYWDYSGRLWFFYSNIIAAAYGWTVNQIAKLPVEDALAYIQEILTDAFLEKEFTHKLSELAYEYNKNTKKSKYRPLQRPYWMLPDFGKPLKARKHAPVPKTLLPVGNVISLQDEIKETKPK